MSGSRLTGAFPETGLQRRLQAIEKKLLKDLDRSNKSLAWLSHAARTLSSSFVELVHAVVAHQHWAATSSAVFRTLIRQFLK
jgi:hypothetical protein